MNNWICHLLYPGRRGILIRTGEEENVKNDEQFQSWEEEKMKRVTPLKRHRLPLPQYNNQSKRIQRRTDKPWPRYHWAPWKVLQVCQNDTLCQAVQGNVALFLAWRGHSQINNMKQLPSTFAPLLLPIRLQLKRIIWKHRSQFQLSLVLTKMETHSLR